MRATWQGSCDRSPLLNGSHLLAERPYAGTWRSLVTSACYYGVLFTWELSVLIFPISTHLTLLSENYIHITTVVRVNFQGNRS